MRSEIYGYSGRYDLYSLVVKKDVPQLGYLYEVQVVTEKQKTDKYDWCVENGYPVGN